MELGLTGQTQLAFAQLPSLREPGGGRALLGEGMRAQHVLDASVVGRWAGQLERPALEGHREGR